MVFVGKKPLQVLLMLVTAITVVTAVALAAILIPGAFGAHFGFPSQQQASSALGVSVNKSAVISKSNYYYSSLYIKKTEAVYYNSTSVVAMIAENQLNSSQSAASFSNSITSVYSSNLGSVNSSSFIYNSVNVSILQFSAGGTGFFFISFHAASFFCFSLVYVYSSNPSLSAKSFAKAFASAVL